MFAGGRSALRTLLLASALHANQLTSRFDASTNPIQNTINTLYIHPQSSSLSTGVIATATTPAQARLLCSCVFSPTPRGPAPLTAVEASRLPC